MVEGDSHAVTHLVFNGCSPLHPCASLIQGILSATTDFEEVSWKHICREVNGCVDALANHGHLVVQGLHVFHNVPSFLFNILFYDVYGGTSFRLENS